VDLALYLRVLWRFRVLVLAGFLLATSLAFFAFVSVSFKGGSPTLKYREQEQWASTVTLLVTEHKFPEGRSVFPQDIPAVSETTRSFTPEFGASSRFIELANLYAQLATSDPVLKLMRRDGPVRGGVQAFPMVTNTDAPLPLVAIQATAPTPESAIHFAVRTTKAFSEYIQSEQRLTGIPEDERVVLEVVKGPNEVELLDGRSKTLPMAVFLTAMLAVLGIAFVLENLRPRIRPVLSEAVSAPDARPARRSA
jgi:hypothetical protein